MNEFKRHWLPRILLGGTLAVLFHALLSSCRLLGAPLLWFLSCGFYDHHQWLGIALSFALFFLFGAEVGVATLPFADSGRELVLRSLAHFAVMAATVSLWAGLTFRQELPGVLLWFLIPLASVYLLVWLERWVGWYMEVAAIRVKLGLAPGPSLFHWKETLPYLGFAVLLCLLLPLGLRLCDDGSVPLLSLMYAVLLLPVGGLVSGLSLGRRHGFCPLYPAVCTLCAALFLLIARTFTHMVDWPLVLIALCAPLLGNGLGALQFKLKPRGGAKP